MKKNKLNVFWYGLGILAIAALIYGEIVWRLFNKWPILILTVILVVIVLPKLFRGMWRLLVGYKEQETEVKNLKKENEKLRKQIAK